MLRIAGCTLIFTGSLLVRRELLHGPTQEIRTMRALATALRLLEQEVALTLLPLPKLLEKVQGEFFFAVVRGVKSGQDFAESWERAAQELTLPQEVKTRFEKLGFQLVGEEESVRKTLIFMAQVMEQEAKRQQSDLREKRKLVNVLCISGGTLACILLL